MKFNFIFSGSEFLRKGRTLILALFWCIGFVIVPDSGVTADDSFFLMMRSASQPVSIVRLLTVLLLPFLLSAFAASVNARWVIFFLAAFKGFCFGFIQLAILAHCGSAAWLVYFLYMFADVMIMPLLFFFWTVCFDQSGRLIQPLVICILYTMLIASVDCCIISPYLAAL